MKNRIEETQSFINISKQLEIEKEKQNKALHADCPQNFKEERAGEAFNLGFPSTKAMDLEIEKSPKVFMEISALATKKVISYDEAEKKLREAKDPNLISKVKIYQNLKSISKTHKKEPGPPNIYINKHKSRSKTRAQVIAKYEQWKAQKELNTEKSTPLDDYPEMVW